LIQDVLNGDLDGAFVAGPIDHPDLVATRAFSEELVLITASRWRSVAELREAKRATGLSILVFRTGCSYRQKLEQILQEMGWPCRARLEMGTLDGIMGCVAADMGVTLLPRAVSERVALKSAIRSHSLKSVHRRVDTWFIRHARRHCSRGLEALVGCLAPKR
jgi:DNA-binding transcriptional LysR family regulator